MSWDRLASANAGIQTAPQLKGKESTKTDHQQLLIEIKRDWRLLETKQTLAKLFGNPTQLVSLLKKITISVSKAAGKEHLFAFLSYSRYHELRDPAFQNEDTKTSKTTEWLFPAFVHYSVTAAAPKIQKLLCMTTHVHKTGISSLSELNQTEILLYFAEKESKDWIICPELQWSVRVTEVKF